MSMSNTLGVFRANAQLTQQSIEQKHRPATATAAAGKPKRFWQRFKTKKA